ncbi:MAG: zinc ribbon domain-containing protein [Bryobacteraceae bacterium]
MLSDLKLVVRLQDVDNRASELMKEVASLPKHIAEIEKKLEGHERKLEADRAALSANQKDRKRLEGDIQTQEQKISKLKGQMADAKNNEQYKAFQTEIEFCEKDIRRCEDRILELMAESDPLDKNVKAAEASLKEEKKQVNAEKQIARDRTIIDQKALSELQAERKGISAQVAPAMFSAYERICKTRRGIAIAEAVDGRCSRCHIALRPQFWQELRRGEKVMYCESCNRILYFNPPQNFEEFAGQSSQTSA